MQLMLVYNRDAEAVKFLWKRKQEKS